MIKFQRLFRSKRILSDEKILSEYYGEKRIMKLLRENCNNIVSELMNSDQNQRKSSNSFS